MKYPEKIVNRINNEGERNLKSERSFDKVSPSSGNKIADVVQSSADEVEKAVSSAEKAFKNWKQISPVKRGEILFNIAALMEQRREEIATVVSIETGKSFKDAWSETGAAINQGRFMAGEGCRMGGRVIAGSDPMKRVMVLREPVGVAGLIIASNTPIANVAWKAFPALICGNTAVMKASEDTPYTANIFAEIAAEGGLPSGVFNVVHGVGEEAGAALVKNEQIKVLSFTGSTEVGKWIEQTIGPRLTKVFLELGGKNPLVICNDADLDLALHWALSSSFSNAGQRCAASSRIIVEKGIYERFKYLFVEKAKNLSLGSKDDDFLGPVINQKQLEKMLDAVNRAQREGASVLTGGQRSQRDDLKNGFYLEPTIIEGSGPKDDISQRELFGPVTNMYLAENFDHALELANCSSYGLTASIHTQTYNRALEFAHRIEAGTVTVNGGTHGSEAHFPFGGVKDSGNGLREPGEEALDVYSSKKNIVLNVPAS